MSKGLETSLVDSIRRELNRVHPGLFEFKVHGSPYQRSGLPDLIVVVDGRFVGMEVKYRRAGESFVHARLRESVRQRQAAKAIRAAGGVCGLVLSVEEAVELASQACTCGLLSCATVAAQDTH